MSSHTRLEDVEAALRRNRGLYSRAAQELGITYGAIRQRVATYPRLAVVVEEARSIRVENAEFALDRAIERGEAWAVAMTLKTLGKDLGYVERTEQQTSGDLKVTVEYVDADPAITETS